MIHKIRTFDDFGEQWSFLRQGLKHFEKDPSTTEEVFFKNMLAVALPPKDGFLALWLNKNHKKLGYVAVRDIPAEDGARTAEVYSMFSTGKDKNTETHLTQAAFEWARSNSYKRLQMRCYKINGSAARFFTELGLHQKCMVFEASVW